MTREMNKLQRLKTVNCQECMNFHCNFKKHIKEINYTACTHVVCDRFKKERVLNPDIAEFFYQTNERLKK